MEVHRINELGPGTLIWVWIGRIGKGRWWPGSILSVTPLDSFPIVDTRFEYRSAGRNGIDGPVSIGISTTRMRYLELRDRDLKGEDRPNFVPSAIFSKPKEGQSGLSGIKHSGTIATDPQTVRPLAAHVKKPRSVKKIEASNPIQDATVVAIET